MYLDVKIGPYILTQRTEYSKIKILEDNKDLTDTSHGNKLIEKLLKEYYVQTKTPEKYFVIDSNNTLVSPAPHSIFNCLFIPDGVKEIGSQSFFDEMIKYIHFPDTVKVISDRAFTKCANLKEVNLPDSITNIKRLAFRGCNTLKKIKLPKNLEIINGYLLSNCFLLEEIHMPKNLKEIKEYAFENCSSLKKIKLPDGLTKICEGVFHGCSDLEEIILPESVTEIEKEAFSECFSLKKFYMPDNITTLECGTFFGCRKLESLKLSKNLVCIEQTAFMDATLSDNFSLPDSVQKIKNDAFLRTKGIENLNIPKNLNYIDGYIFRDSHIKSLTFNYDLKCLDKKSEGYLFDYDLIAVSSIEKLIIKNTVNIITPKAFSVSGLKIKQIDYQGTEPEFNKFKENNKELFKLFGSLEKINFVNSHYKEDIKDIQR